MKLTRRILLQMFGGAAAGVVLSPTPFKLLDDVAIWTQNWSWIAVPPKGPVSTRYTNCTLCPGGCGLRVRMIGESPVSLWPVENHPLSKGRLCPLGLGASQMRFHPTRIKRAFQRDPSREDSWEAIEMSAALSRAGAVLASLKSSGEMDKAAVLDLRPGRSLSRQYCEFLEDLGGGRYLTVPSGRDVAASTFGEIVESGSAAPGYDLGNSGVILSFGAPLLEGWTGYGPSPELLESRSKPEGGPILIQAESNLSPTASKAHRWLPIKPGTEAALALGLANVILARNLYDATAVGSVLDMGGPGQDKEGYRALVRGYTPEKVSAITGLSADTIIDTAQTLAAKGPAVAIGGGDCGAGPLGVGEEAAIWGLNILLGSLGREGGVSLLSSRPDPVEGLEKVTRASVWDVPDGSTRFLLIDGSTPHSVIPWERVKGKLAKGAMVVSASPFLVGPAVHSDIVIPTAAPGEWVDDMSSESLASFTSYGLGMSLVEQKDALHPSMLLDSIAEAAGGRAREESGKDRLEALMKARVDAIHASGAGMVFKPGGDEPQKVSELDSSEIWRALKKGGCWYAGSAAPSNTLKYRLLGRDRALAARIAAVANGRPASGDEKNPLVLVPTGRSGAAGGGVVPPALNKLYRESEFKQGTSKARINPATGEEQGLADGARAGLETATGSLAVTVLFDEAIMPGLVLVATGPDPVALGDGEAGDGQHLLKLCNTTGEPVWRLTRAVLKET